LKDEILRRVMLTPVGRLGQAPQNSILE